MTIGELRTLLSGFPAEGTINIVTKGEKDSFYVEITETNYNVDCKLLSLEGWVS